MAAKIYTTHGVTVKYEDNSDKVLMALQQATKRGLEACGAIAVNYAKQELNKPKVHTDGSIRPNVITGRLRNSIGYSLGGDVGSGIRLYIGTNVSYGAFVELGTRKSPAYPYLKPAVTEHTNEYRNLLKESLKNA